MAALPNRVRVHRAQTPRGAAPTLPSPDTRAGEATNTSRRRRILCRSRTRAPSPSPDLGRSRTVVDHNIQA
jgi:hypothetical protein